MDSGPTRWIVVDDTSSDINYVGRSWFSDVGSWDSIGYYGTPYLSTLHGTSSNASFTFNFTGSSVTVFGSNLGTGSKYWTCSVDGVAASTDMSDVAPLCPVACNNFLLCHAGALDDGPLHTLVVNTTATSNQTFWFDRVEYVPSPQVSREQKAIRVTSWDSELSGKGFTFYGVSVSWYGMLPENFNANKSNFSWSMDQGDANYTWNWKGRNLSNSNLLRNQKFFETPIYPMGQHTLKVDYGGMDYLIIQNGTLPSKSTSRSSSPSLTSSTTGITFATSGTLGPVTRRVPSRVIAGVVTGGILFFGIAVSVFFFFCRRSSNGKTAVDSDEPIPFDQKPAHIVISPQTHPVQRKSPILPIHSRSNANTANLPPSGHSQMHRTEPVNKSSTPVAGQQPQPNPSSEQHDAVDVEQGDSNQQPLPSCRVSGPSEVVVHQNNGVRSSGEALATPVIHLPPQYTLD